MTAWYWTHACNAYHRRAARWFARRLCTLPTGLPMVSFTFDDFPLSALTRGGRILERNGCAGTYYTSVGLAGSTGSSGEYFRIDDLAELLEHGHELGCHTFDHFPAWETPAREFAASVTRNSIALQASLPQARFHTHSYPISYPRPRTKHLLSTRFACCRGGGQTHNTGVVDLNYLASFFIEQVYGEFRPVKAVIDANRRDGGWLIFSTHDVAPFPSRFGCTPAFFERVVAYAAESGALILPVYAAWTNIQSRSRQSR